MVRFCLSAILPVLGLALAGCAGDTRETLEPAYRRDNWDVQQVHLRVRPDTHLSWCMVANDRFSLSLHSVPGTVLIPVRGGDMVVTCRTHRGLTGTSTVPRGDGGRWPDEIEVALVPDQRVEETREGRPGPVSVAPLARR